MTLTEFRRLQDRLGPGHMSKLDLKNKSRHAVAELSHHDPGRLAIPSYAIQNLFQVDLSLFKRIVEPGTVMSRAGSINPLRSSSVVTWSFCSEFWSPVEGPDGAGSYVFLRENVRLPPSLTIITIIHSVSVPMPATTTSGCS